MFIYWTRLCELISIDGVLVVDDFIVAGSRENIRFHLGSAENVVISHD